MGARLNLFPDAKLLPGENITNYISVIFAQVVYNTTDKSNYGTTYYNSTPCLNEPELDGYLCPDLP